MPEKLKCNVLPIGIYLPVCMPMQLLHDVTRLSMIPTIPAGVEAS